MIVKSEKVFKPLMSTAAASLRNIADSLEKIQRPEQMLAPLMLFNSAFKTLSQIYDDWSNAERKDHLAA